MLSGLVCKWSLKLKMTMKHVFINLIEKMDVLVSDVRMIRDLLEAALKDDVRDSRPQSQEALTRMDFAEITLDENEWLMTIEEALGELGIARSTLSELRRAGLIGTVGKGRNVRLRSSEVARVKRWYSARKGKI